MALNAAELQIVITADASQAQGEINNVEGMISGVLVGNKIKDLGADALGFVGDFISVGATFEEQMTLIDRIIGGTVSHMDDLKQKAIDADIRTMFDAMEVTKGMEMLARAGFDATQIIGTPGQNNGLIDAVLNFAGATAESTEVAGRSFAAVARIFQNSGMSMTSIADLLTAAVLRSGKSASEFMTAFQYVGSISQQFGTAPDEIVTVIALMEQLGVRSMSVGTSLRSFYSGIASNRGDIEAMGVSLYTLNDAGEEVLRSLPDIIAQFHKLSTTMNPDAFYAMLEDTFGKPAASGLMTLFTVGAENMDRFTASMDDVNDAQSIMDARMNTLRGSLEKFSATWLGLKKVLGDSVSGIIKPFVDAATYLVNLLQNAPQPILQAVAALIALAGAIAVVGGSLIVFNALGGAPAMAAAFGMIASAAWPLVAVLAAVGLGVAAFKTDFGGVATWIDGIGDKIDEFKHRYHQGQVYNIAKGIVKGHARQDQVEIEQMYSGNYMKIANALAAVRDMGGPDLLGLWKKLFPHVKEVAEGIDRIGRGFHRLSNIIKKDGIAAGLRDLFGGRTGKLMMAGLGDIISEAPRMLGEFLRNFDTGSKRFNTIFKNFGQGFKLFGNAIEHLFDGDLSGAWDSFVAGLQRMIKGGKGIGSVVLDIAQWGFTTTVDLAAQFLSWVKGKLFGTNSHVVMGPGGDFAGATIAPGTDGIPIGSITLSIIGWIITSTVSLVSAVISKLIEWWPSVLQAVKDGWHLAVGISTWVVNEVSDGSLYTTAWNFIKAQLATKDITIDGLVIKINTNDLDITLDLPSLWETVKSKFEELTTFTPAEQDQAQRLGENLGENAVHYIFVGLKKIINIDNIKKLLGLSKKKDSAEGDQSMAMAITRFIIGFFKGVGVQLAKELDILLDDWENELTMWNARWQSRFHLWLSGGLVANTPGSTGHYQEGIGSKLWDGLKDALTPTLDFDAPEMPSWMSTDFAWLDGPVNAVVNKIDAAIEALKKAWDRLLFWKEHPGDLNNGAGPVNANPQADFLLNRDLNGAPGTRDENGNPIPARAPLPTSNQPQTFLNIATPIQTGVESAGKILTTFANEAPGKMDSLKAGLERVAQVGMARFNGGLGIGYMNAVRMSLAAAAQIAAAATPPDMWNTGFNVGYNLGAGMAAGINAAIGLVVAARDNLMGAGGSGSGSGGGGGGSDSRNSPFNGGSSANSVPPKQPTVVHQTNHINMDLGSVQGLVQAGSFVANLDRQRQITLGRV